MVLLRENGMTQPEISEAMGVSLSTVNRAHMAYDHGGRSALEPKPSAGRIRENISLVDVSASLGLKNPAYRPGLRQYECATSPLSISYKILILLDESGQGPGQMAFR
jgi:Winged helix-turn helix